MIKFIYVFNLDKAKKFAASGFKYSKSQINDKDVCLFEATPEMMEVISSEFDANEFFICDKLIF